MLPGFVIEDSHPSFSFHSILDSSISLLVSQEINLNQNEEQTELQIETIKKDGHTRKRRLNKLLSKLGVFFFFFLIFFWAT